MIVSHVGAHYVVKDAGWNGSVPVKGSVSIGFGAAPGGTITAPYNIKLNGQGVNPDEDKPIANNDTATVDQDKSVTIDVLKNDSGKNLTISKVSSPAHGTTVIENEKIIYTPEKTYSGADAFTYSAKDSNALEATANVSVTILKAPEPEAPVANPDTASTKKDTSALIDVLSNDTVTNGSLSLESVTQPPNGTAEIFNGKIEYTPKSGFTGLDSFSYTVKDSLGLAAIGLVSVYVNTEVASNKVNATYWSIWGNNTSYNIGGKQITSTPIDLDKIDSSYNCLIVAFIITDSNGDYYLAYNLDNPSSGVGTYTEAQVKQFIANAKAQGRKVIVSVGGEQFHLDLKSESQIASFVTQIQRIVDEYDFDGLDLDLESGSFSSNPVYLGQAVSQIISHYREQGKNFWLTAAPEWPYIVPFAWGSGQWASHSLAGDFYINLIKTIGVNNFTYIWPQMYNQGPANGITAQGGTKTSPADGMDKFLAGMVWAATTQAGYEANGSIGLQIPASKFALGIPATEGAAGGEMAYIATPSLIASACNLIESQGNDVAGFMNWSVDWDALKITDGQLTAGYSHEPWDTGRAVANALNINSTPIPVETQLSFASLTDGQTIEMSELSTVDILLSIVGNASDIDSITIEVDGKIYQGTEVSWIPNDFGQHRIVAEAIEKSGATIILAINVCIEKTTVVPQPSPSKKQIIGYFTQWDAWKGESFGLPAKGVYNQLNIDYSKYTILNYSFFGVAKDGSLHSADFRNKAMTATNTTADQEPAPMINDDIYSSWDIWLLYGDVQYDWSTSPAKLVKVADGAKGLFDLCKENNVKLMASIGGWSMSKHFSDMANSATMKASFLKDCKTLMEMGFDGIDIDWEFPGAPGMNFPGKDYDCANFVYLMRDLRATIGPDKLITAAFSAVPARLNNFDWKALSANVDYFNIMSYDLEGGWSDFTGHHSPLYGDENSFCWNNTVKFLTEQKGVNPEKINMGTGFYGRGIETQQGAYLGAQTKKSMKSFSIDGSLESAADFANWGLFEGTPNYSYITRNTSDWFYHWDDVAKVPYMTKDNYFLSYDNPESIGLKADYVNNKNLGGVIVWQVFGDMQFEGGVSYVNPSVKKLPKANKVTTPLLDVLYTNLNK